MDVLGRLDPRAHARHDPHHAVPVVGVDDVEGAAQRSSPFPPWRRAEQRTPTRRPHARPRPLRRPLVSLGFEMRRFERSARRVERRGWGRVAARRRTAAL